MKYKTARKLHVKLYRPKLHVGLNLMVYFLYIGFRPTGHYLVVGLNPEVEKFDSGFKPRGHYLEMVDSGFRSSGHYVALVGLNPEVE